LAQVCFHSAQAALAALERAIAPQGILPGDCSVTMTVLSRRQDDVSSAVSVSECPFARLGMDDTKIEEYLSDARTRLCGEHWQLQTSKKIETMVLRNQGPEFIAAYESVKSRQQDAMKTRIVEFRNKIRRFAITLVESVNFSHDGREQLATETFNELQGLDVEIRAVYDTNKAELTQVIREFHAAVSEHVRSSSSANDSAKIGSVLAGGGKWLGGFGLVPLIGWLHPQVLSTTDMTNRWYKPVERTSDGTIYYSRDGVVKMNSKGAFRGIVFAAVAAMGAMLLSHFSSRREARAAHAEKLATLNALHLKFVGLNDHMWEGMIMWVEDVQQSIQVLKNLNPERKLMKSAQLNDIAFKLFGMSMAVDEYIIWLSRHGYFPVNFSIRNWITPQRYDRIKSIVDEPGTCASASSDAETPQLGQVSQ